jgi:hypothetical protein
MLTRPEAGVFTIAGLCPLIRSMSPARNSAAWCTAAFSSSATTIWLAASFEANTTSPSAGVPLWTHEPRRIVVQGAV